MINAGLISYPYFPKQMIEVRRADVTRGEVIVLLPVCGDCALATIGWAHLSIIAAHSTKTLDFTADSAEGR